MNSPAWAWNEDSSKEILFLSHLSSVIISDTNDKHLYFIQTHSCVLVPSQNSHSPRWLTFIFKNYVHPIFLRYQFTVIYGSARVRNVICATDRKRVGCGLKYGGFRRVRVCKIRPGQDSDLCDHLNHLANYQAKYPTCQLTSKTAVEDDGYIFPFSNTGFIYASGFTWNRIFWYSSTP